jgi:hypothetical protein
MLAEQGGNVMPRGGARPGAGRKPKADAAVRKEFTAEQLKELVMSDYIISVSRKGVTYTEAFKVLFWTRYNDGVDVADIFNDAGIKPEIIGRERMRDLARLIKAQKEKESYIQITAEEKPQIPEPPNKPKHSKFALSEQEISRMYHQVAYMSQELAFIKKIISSETEGK